MTRTAGWETDTALHWESHTDRAHDTTMVPRPARAMARMSAVRSGFGQARELRRRRREVRDQLVAAMVPGGGKVLQLSDEIDSWFRRRWYAPAPLCASQLRDTFVGAIRVRGYEVLIVVGPQVRAVYLAAWIGDTTIAPTQALPYAPYFDDLGFEASVDDGGLLALADPDALDPVDAAGNALRAARLLADLATDLTAIP